MDYAPRPDHGAGGMTLEELLKCVVDERIMKKLYAQETQEMDKREQCLKMHPYKIWEGKNGKWYTHLPDKNKKEGRRLVKRSTEKELKDAVVEFWEPQINDPTIREVFNEWNDRRLEFGKIADSTHMRNIQIFNRHYKEMGKRKIRSLMPDEIEEFLEEQICRHGLTAKAFNNLKTVTKGFLKYAKKKRLVSFAVTEMFEDMDLTDRMFKKVIKEDYEEVFNDDEMGVMVSYLEENPDLKNIGILLLFVTGMRIGELVALKYDDFDSDCTAVRIRRTETTYKDDSGKWVYDVRDFPKSKAGVRTVIIPEGYAWAAEKILSMKAGAQSEYVFFCDGKRMNTRVIRDRLRRLCKKLDIYNKSPHKIRKTYGSILLDNNIDNKLVTELMGHSDIQVTEIHYHRNRRDLAAKAKCVNSIPEFSAAPKREFGYPVT